MMAAQYGHTDALNALLEAGADVHAATKVPPGPLGAPARVTPPRRAGG